MAETVKKGKAPGKTRRTNDVKSASNVESIQRTNSAPSHDQIAELARKYWAERGYTEGHQEEDWLRAEQALRAKAS